MTVSELLAACAGQRKDWQLHVSAFVDEFRGAPADVRASMIAEGPAANGQIEGLVAAVVSALCRETDTPAPGWVAETGSPTPFFAFPARGFALRLRLMLESPPPFRARNVFVPADYLARA